MGERYSGAQGLASVILSEAKDFGAPRPNPLFYLESRALLARSPAPLRSPEILRRFAPQDDNG
jgi:hypothetical protein